MIFGANVRCNHLYVCGCVRTHRRHTRFLAMVDNKKSLLVIRPCVVDKEEHDEQAIIYHIQGDGYHSQCFSLAPAQLSPASATPTLLALTTYSVSQCHSALLSCLRARFCLTESPLHSLQTSPHPQTRDSSKCGLLHTHSPHRGGLKFAYT